MDLFFLFNLLTATFTGASLGSYLLITLLYNALLKPKQNFNDALYIYRRFYRLNTGLCLLGGICAALINHQTAALMLAILAASHVFNHAHILKGLSSACNAKYQIVNEQQFKSLSSLQNIMHVLQVLGAGYTIYLLSLAQ
jgi:hypothetical protein